MKTASQGILNFCWLSLFFFANVVNICEVREGVWTKQARIYFKFLNQPFFLLFLDSSCIWIFITSYSMQIVIFAYDNMLLAVQVSLPKFLNVRHLFFNFNSHSSSGDRLSRNVREFINSRHQTLYPKLTLLNNINQLFVFSNSCGAFVSRLASETFQRNSAKLS